MAETTKPKLNSASINGSTLVLNYWDWDFNGLDAAHPPGTNAFEVNVAGVSRAVTGVVVDAQAMTVTLTLASPVDYRESVFVSYRDPSSGDDANAIQDASGKDAASFEDQRARNETPDTTAPVFDSASVNGVKLKLRYSDNDRLDRDHPPDAGAFTVLVDGVERAVIGLTVKSKGVVVLTLATPVEAGQTVTVAYADPTGGDDANAIEDRSGNDAASLAATAAANTTRDTSGPVFDSATVDGTALVLAYTDAQALDAANPPAAGSFTVMVEGGARAVTGVAVDANAKTVTLTLSSAVTNGQAVTVAYTDTTAGDDANAIQDASGNDAASLSSTAVTNNTAETTAPVFASAAVNGASLVLTYTELNLLDATNVPDTTAFTVMVAGVARTVDSVAVDADAKTVTLTLASAAANGEVVTVAYTDTTAGDDANAIQDDTGNDAATLSATSVTNNTPDTTAPVFASAAVNGSSLVMTYTELNLLDATNVPATTTFTVMVAGVARTVDSVSVDADAKTVTLTLASAVANGEAVTAAYTDTTAGDDANAIQDDVGNDAASLSDTTVTNNTPDTTAPVFASAAVDGASLVMTYTELNLLDATNIPATTAFTVMVAGVARTVDSVSVDADAKTVTLTLASAVANGEVVTVAYTDTTAGDDASAVQDASGNDAATLSDTSVTNNTPDTTAPVFASAAVDGASLVMTYTELNLLDATNVPATTDFTVMVAGVARTVDSVSVDADAKTVTLTLASAVANGEAVTVAYTDTTAGDDANAIQDDVGNDAASLSDTAVTNNTPDTTAPVFASAAVNGSSLVMTYTELNLLDATNIPATTDFTVMVAGVARTVDSVSVDADAKTVTLTLASAVANGEVVTVAYTDTTAGDDANAIQDDVGNDAATLSDTAVTNNTPDTTAPVFSSAAVNGASLVLTYTELNLLDATNIPATTAFTVMVAGVPRTVDSVSVDANAKTVTLTLASAVANGEVVTVAYTDTTAGDDASAIQDASGNDAETLSDTAVTNNTPDTTAPVFASAAVNGSSLVLTYTELNLLDATNIPATTAFTVMVAGVARTVDSVSVDANAKTVTLTLASAVANGQVVTVAYTDTTAGDDANAVQDASGNDAGTLSDTAVTNNTPDTTAPVFDSAAVNGSSLVMTYTELNLLDATNTPATTDFTVMVAGVARTVDSMSVDADAKTVTLTLASAVANGEVVTIAYTDATAGDDANAIQDDVGNDAASLGATAVTNNTPDTTAPVFASAAVNGASLALTYTELNLLDATNTPATTAFTVMVAGVSRTVDSVSVDANAKTVTLTLASAVANGEVVTVAYTDATAGDDTNAIQDASGNDAATLSATAVTNNTPDTTAPVFSSATVNGSSLEMTYTELNLLDATNIPATTDFTVMVAGVARTVDSVSVDANAKTVTLTLASAVTSGQAVTVAYTDSTADDDASAIQDASGNDAATLSATAATNATPAASTISLSSLDGSTGFRLDGAAAGDYSGRSVSAAGDVNGDGFADLIVGADRADNGSSASGSSYVVFGQASDFASALSLSSLDGSTGFRLDGAAADDYSGYSVSAAGDVNGDGFADLIVGAKFADNGGAISGASYVLFGQASGFSSSISLSSLDGSTGFRLDGAAAYDFSGRSVSAAGDINGDGLADLIVGAYGADDGGSNSGSSYVVFGQASEFASALSLSSLDGSTGFRLDGAAADDRSGRSVSAAGDVNGDGYADLIVGADLADNGGTGSGSSYVVFGQASGFASALSLSSLDGSTGFRLDGAAAYDSSGQSVSAAGDVNGDGFADLIVGAYLADNGSSVSGSSYVVFGQASGFASTLSLSSLDGSTGFRLDGVAANDRSGQSVSAAGDVNGDGFADLIVGASRADNGGNSTGSSYVVFGQASGFASAIGLSSLDGSTGFRLDGVAADDRSGRSVSAAGDVNGDGFADLVVGATGADNGGASSGSSYVIFGSNSTASVTFLGTSSADDLNAGTSAAEQFAAGGDSDSMTGGGGADVFHGGEGDDTITVPDLTFQLADGGSGDDTLALAGSGISLTLADERGRITDIEKIDLTGSGNNTLDLTDLDLLNLSQTSNTLTVDGDAGDVVNAGSGWVDEAIYGGYHTYTQGQAVLKVNTAVTANLTLATPATAISLSSLDGSTGFRLDGVAANDRSGQSVSAAGDVNGDGFADLIVGAYLADNGGSSSGSSYVVFGQASGFASTLNLSSLDGDTGFRLDGAAAYDYSGFSVSAAGDVNGDGLADLIVGANYAGNGGANSGSSYVVFGQSSGFASAVSLDGSTGFRLDGAAANDISGVSVSAAGDVNGDGLADLIVGAELADNGGSASGSSYVVFGQASDFASSFSLSSLDGDTGFRLDGAAAGDNSGRSVSAAGDVNGDGFADLIVGTPFADNGGANSGASYVVFGQASDFASVISLSGLDGSTGFRLDGAAAGDISGLSVSAAGDVNGDGLADLIVGAYLADNGGNASGASYVVFGQASGFASALSLSGLDGSTGFRLDGAAANDYSGFSVSAAGDVNGDGFADLIVGAYRADNGDSNSGSSYVVFGQASGFASAIGLSSLDGSTGFRLDGAAADDRSGKSVSAAGDVNGDGFADLIVGARLADNGGASSGSSYVVFGSNSTASVTFLGTSGADDLNAGTSAAEQFVAGGDSDSMTGGGGADVFHGGEGDDTITVADLTFQLADGGSGTDTLALAGSGIAMTLADERGRIDGIEAIDLTGSGNNTLDLTDLDLLNLSQTSNTLTVEGDAGDAVNASGTWIDGGTSGDYHTYTQGQAILKINTAITTVSIATPASVIALSSLDGSTGFRLNGAAANDRSGRSVSAAGDVNGDGFADLIVGAYLADNGGSSSGSSYVVFGQASGFASTLSLSSLDGSTGFRLDGVAASDLSGWSVSAAGDVNGDGFADLIVGAIGADNGGANSGSSYVVFGQASGFASVISLSSLDGSTGFRLDGAAASDESGRSVSAAGDVNGDGFADLIVGAYNADNGGSLSGSSYVVFGQASGSSSINLSSLDGSTGFRLDGKSANDRSGESVSAAGDVNGDGYADLIVGARYADNGGVNSGSSYVVFGQASGFASTLSLSSLNGSTGFRLDGVAANDYSGYSVSEAGDVNGDGFADLIVGAYEADHAGSYSGSSYVVFGQASGFSSTLSLSSLDGSTGFRLDGAAANDFSGWSVSAAGDVNGDGFADLIVGADGADNGGTTSGSSYVVFGQASGFASTLSLSSLDGSTGFRLDGAAANDRSGRSVSAAGDVNGDGFADLIVGAYRADHGGSASGSSYVIFGSNSTSSVTFLGTSSADDLNTGTSAAEQFVAGGDSDAMTGGGGADVFHGGEGDDTITVPDLTFQLADGGSGTDTLALAGSGISLTLADMRGRITDIEAIDLTGSGNNTLDLTDLDLLNLSQTSNTLTVDGDAGDVVNAGSGWTDEAIYGGYHTYTQGQAVLKVNAAVTANLTLATPASAINLSSLDGSTGFRLDGKTANDYSGFSVSAAGDVNGDGFADLIVGAYLADSGGGASGTSYVVFGQASGFASTLNLSSLDGSTGFRLNGAAVGDRSGRSVSTAGDVNGDGFADLIVGAHLADKAGNYSGSSYVVFGQASGFASAISLSSLDGSTGFRLDGAAANDFSGRSVSAAGDVNGDGFADLIVGANYADDGGIDSGSSYVVFGQASGFASALSLSSLDGSTGFRLDGAAANDNSGISVSEAGDVNGDGFADLIVGAYLADNGGTSSGSSYVVFGQASGFASALSLSSLDGSTGFRLDGKSAYDYSGCSVNAAGDVNGDGFADLIVGAYGADNGGIESGSSYVVFGQASGFASAISLSSLDGSTGFRLEGKAATDYSGWSVSEAGDVNGDGFADLIVGAWGANNGGTSSGSSYVVFGQASGFASAVSLSSLDGSTGFRLDGAAANHYSGRSVNAAGDVNGDGFADLIVGAFGTDNNGSDSGSSYVIFGSNSTASVTFLGTSSADDLNDGTSSAEQFVAGGDSDSMTGGGGADVFHGGEGDDTITVSDLTFQLVDGGSGDDTLALAGSGISLTLADERGRITDIEKIDLTGSGNNTLNLTALDVLNLSDTSNTLIVDGDAGDVVTGLSSFSNDGTQVIDLITYDVYSQGQAVVLIAVAVGNDWAA